MILGNRRTDSRLLIKLAMLALMISIAWPRLIPAPSGLSEEWIDGIKGALMGMALGLIILAARFGAFNRRQTGK
jgi:hypothetical protein